MTPMATLCRQQATSHWWPFISATRTQGPGTTSGRVGLHKLTQKWLLLEDDTHLTQVHGTEKAADLQPLLTATTDSWTSAAQSAQSHGLLAAWYSFNNWKMKEPLTGYRAGARHTKS